MFYPFAFGLLAMALALISLDYFGAIHGAGGFANLALMASVLLLGAQGAIEAVRRHHPHHSH